MTRRPAPLSAGLGAGLLLVAVPAALSLLLLFAVGALPQPFPGLPDPGALTRWGLPVTRGIRDGSAALTIGLLLLTTFVLPPDSRRDGDRLGGARARAVRLAAPLGALWAVSGASTLALTYSDLAGVPAVDSISMAAMASFVTDFDLGRSLAASTALSLIAALLAATATRPTTAAWALVAAVLSLLPLALTGHAAGAANHELAVDAQAAHLVGISAWVGGLGAIMMLRRHLGHQLPVVAVRFSGLAGWAYLLVAVSGVGSGLARLDGWEALNSPYGALLGAKMLLFVVLGAAGWAHRRRLLPTLADDGSRTGFARLVAAEVVLMSVGLGLAAALSATPPPVSGGPTAETRAESLLGYPMPPPIGAGLHWLTQWRIDTVWVPVAVLAVCWYAVAANRLRSRGDAWPVGRTVAWLAGWVLMALATSASPGVYGPVLFSAHMVQHMTVAMAVPVLLVFGAPVTLALRTLHRRRDGSRGPREWLLAMVHSRPLAVLGHPLVAAGMFIASLAGFYYSPLFELALRTHTGHVLMTAHFLLSGYLLASAIVGVDPGPARPAYPFRMILLMATFGFHAFFAVAMMSSTTVLGGDWFAALDRPWGNSLAREQYLGGALGWAIGDYPVAMMTVAMAIGWIRSDAREARRYDRQVRRDGDAALAAYNDHLARLAARTAATRKEYRTDA